MEAKGVESEFKNSYTKVPQLILLLSTSFTATIESVQVRVVVGCQIDCVIVNAKVSALKMVSSIVSAAVVQDAMTFTMKLREPAYE